MDCMPQRKKKHFPDGKCFKRRKSSLMRSFPPKVAPFAYSPTARRAANGVRKALLRKAAGPTAHVAGPGIKIGGLRPSDTSPRVYALSGWKVLF